MAALNLIFGLYDGWSATLQFPKSTIPASQVIRNMSLRAAR